MDRALAASRAIERIVEKIAFAAGTLFFALAALICFDVATRKFGYQVPGFGSTRIGELEWHLHAALLSFWLGYAYLRNAHVRIDVVTSQLAPRLQAWLELAGCTLLALPFCLTALYFGVRYSWIAYVYNESSESISGLPYRFIPKGILTLGLALLLASVLAVMLRLAVRLFGPPHLRDSGSLGSREGPGAS